MLTRAMAARLPGTRGSTREVFPCNHSELEPGPYGVFIASVRRDGDDHVTINGAPGLVMRHPSASNGTCSFDIADGRIRAIYLVRNPELPGFLERTH